MPQIWPFKPRNNYIETLGWLTDITETQEREQRFAMRGGVPRQNITITHTLTGPQLNAAETQFRLATDGQFLLPDWPLMEQLPATEPSSAPSLPLAPELAATLAPGSQGLLWQDNGNWEVVTVEGEDSAGVSVQALGRSFASPFFVPLRPAQATSPLQTSRSAQPLIDTQADFLFLDGEDIGQSSYPQLNGHDVITDCARIGGGSFSETTGHRFSEFDADIGYPELDKQRTPVDATGNMRWHVFGRAEVLKLRQFLYSRRGRQKAFWLPSFKNDFALAQQITPTDTQLAVYAPAGIAQLPATDFYLTTPDRTALHVIAASQTTTPAGRPLLVLDLSAPAGTSVSTTQNLSYLRLHRFDNDNIAITHNGRAGTVCAVACKQITA